MKVWWAFLSIIAMVICFSLGSVFFSIIPYWFFHKYFGSYLQISTMQMWLFFILGIFFYILGVFAIYLLFRKSKIAYGYIISLVANVVLLITICLIYISPVFDIAFVKLGMLRTICPIGWSQLQNKQLYDLYTCRVDQNLKVTFDRKLPTKL